MNFGNPKRLFTRYEIQRSIHHEWRSPKQYLYLLGILVCLIILYVPAHITFHAMDQSREAFEDASWTNFKNLTLAHTKADALKIPNKWIAKTKIRELGKNFVRSDNAFIMPYMLFFMLVSSFACGFAYFWNRNQLLDQRQQVWQLLHWGILMLGIVALAGFDTRENFHLERLITNSTVANLASLRLFTQAKLVTLALVALGTLFALVVGFRREIRFWNQKQSVRLRWSKQTTTSSGVFSTLITTEYQRILEARRQSLTNNTAVLSEESGEPRVARCKEDFVGLALSGGGIRSATFNLGLLQGLHRFDLLRHVDYLATVSGGGYIGSFWSRWLKETAPNGQSEGRFPDEIKESRRNFSGDSRVFEAPEIRHIREFSNFLFPRVGIFDTETWGGAVALIASILPAVVTSLCVLGLSLIFWLLLSFYMACPDLAEPWAGMPRATFLAAITALFLWLMERWWRAAPTGDRNKIKDSSVVFRSTVAVGLMGALVWIGPDTWMAWFGPRLWRVWIYSDSFATWYWSDLKPSYANWWKQVGIVSASPVAEDGWIWIPRLYEPAITWVLVCAIFLLFRFKGTFTKPSLGKRVMLPANDRVTMRLLGVATLWALFATFWHIGLNLKGLTSVYVMGGGAAGSAGLFALLRNWIGETLARPHKASLWEKLKPYVPQVLAYLAIGLAWAVLASKLIELNGRDWFAWYQTALFTTLPILLVLFVDPHEFGMHAVYRDRICRTYLGAALRRARSAAQNRQTDFRRGDDVALSSLLPRPLHLICCAANNVGGDHLSTLSRGARSAVLSRDGVIMGNDWRSHLGLTLGSAVTASAAAANPNMGSVSMRVGPAVSFLMSALNLRLGLWVDNPQFSRSPRDERLLPGWRYFKEMIAWTDTSVADIHLSDGGHFDNFGLYELVRRHCRYIIVSDATADPDVAFDDFGNTARRIREDFGIEIDIDLEPLKLSVNGWSRQHAVVGMIDYGGFDKGILVYIKPSMTGDEPVDAAQYKTRNPNFPHESTGDQFYDEAQWESYRRLGVHIVNRVFDFVEHIPADEQQRVHKVFNEARQTWYPTPAGLAERSLQMTERYSHLEHQLKFAAEVPMLREIFPEINYTAAQLVGPVQPISTEQELANIGCLLSIMTLIEDTITACDLQTHWRHPMNLGWVNLFSRWATSPTFQKWWPLLKPMYGPGLREFLEDRFDVLRDKPVFDSATISRFTPAPHSDPGFAFEWWQTRHASADFSGRRVYQYNANLSGGPSTTPTPLQLAIVAIKVSGTKASWTSDHLFVPFSLWGSKLAVHFLAKLLEHLISERIQKCEVIVKEPSQLDNNQAKWEERQGFVNFYHQVGFRLEKYEAYEEATSTGGTRKGRSAVMVMNLV